MEIQFSGVSKVFPPDINALENIYLKVSKGEFVYLIGETGSGKTTLMRCIFREVLPSRGHISVGGRVLRKMGRFELALFRRDIGVIFQDFALLPNLTAFENVAFVLEIMGMPRREIDARVNDVLKTMGIWRRRALYPQQLSGGEQQRLAIARAVVNEPSLLLADEPTGNLDNHTADEIMHLLLDINAAGTTVIMATHNQYLVDCYKHRVVELYRGRIVRDDPEGGYYEAEGGCEGNVEN
ncbi:MAG: ATP-binding cassette domain-containing protein [Synergistes sp.]|nr:ATP-binding cassette domain-containing protein [Synergistes sp.]